jgi:hypothetical protein
MYQDLLSHNFVKYLQDKANIYIEIDRRKYDDVYNSIIEFVSKSKAILDDVDILIGEHVYWNCMISIYDEDPKNTTLNLMKVLCDKFEKKFLLKEIEIGKEYNIEYNRERLCAVSYLEPKVNQAFKPVQRVINNITISLRPPIIDLMILYTDLYNPAKAKEWPTILKKIKGLSSLIDRDTYIKESMAEKKKPIEDKKAMSIGDLIYKFITDTDYILLNEINESSGFDNVIPSIISKNDIAYDFNSFNLYVKRFKDMTFTYSEQELYLPDPMFLLKKHIIYSTKNNGIKLDRVPILQVYNNMSYELIAYDNIVFKKNTFKVSDPISKLTFLYMDLYEATLLKSLFKKEYTKDYITSIFERIDINTSRINIYEKKSNYIGIYMDKGICKKKRALADPSQKSIYYCHNIA